MDYVAAALLAQVMSQDPEDYLDRDYLVPRWVIRPRRRVRTRRRYRTRQFARPGLAH